MFRLLNFEFRKLIRQKSFYICIGVMLALLLFSAYTAELMTSESGIENPELNGTNYLMEAVSSSALFSVLAVFIPLFVCEDYASGTIRNVITRGFSRFEIFAAKLIAVIFASVFMTAVCLAAAVAGQTFGYGQKTVNLPGQLRLRCAVFAG